MVKIWEENEVTLDCLVAHLCDSGLKPNTLHDDEAWFRTESGLGYCVSIMDDKKFAKIRSSTSVHGRRIEAIRNTSRRMTVRRLGRSSIDGHGSQLRSELCNGRYIGECRICGATSQKLGIAPAPHRVTLLLARNVTVRTA